MFEYQNAFVGGGQILDVAFIANKAIALRKRSLRLGLVCKLDIEKTYDHVNWKFLFFVMKKKSFVHQWRRWIHLCISTMRLSIFVNDTLIDFFQSFGGLI